jgi:DNA-directed RNA polymerase subunit alpha
MASPVSLPKKPKVVESSTNRAVIEIDELYPGYGATLGNSLRRVLYSSLEGAAITSVKIEGVSHEFSTVEGVLEDVLELCLNLKSIRMVLHGDEPQTLTLNVKGKKAVSAKDIETPSQVEIVNTDVHIATLTSSTASLKAELTVERGVGYVQAEQDGKEKKEIGVIRLDAAFSPVVKINFDVENTRVGDRTDYNKLLIDITTDGTLAPEDAYEKAVAILLEHVGAITELEGKPVKKASAKKSAEKTEKVAKKVKAAKK